MRKQLHLEAFFFFLFPGQLPELENPNYSVNEPLQDQMGDIRQRPCDKGRWQPPCSGKCGFTQVNRKQNSFTIQVKTINMTFSEKILTFSVYDMLELPFE